jgi:hypothetical protein
MEGAKEPERLKRMLEQGQTEQIDPISHRKYSMVAYCPKDKSEAFVARVEKSDKGISRIYFQCTECFEEFEVKPDEIFLN